MKVKTLYHLTVLVLQLLIQTESGCGWFYLKGGEGLLPVLPLAFMIRYSTETISHDEKQCWTQREINKRDTVIMFYKYILLYIKQTMSINHYLSYYFGYPTAAFIVLLRSSSIPRLPDRYHDMNETKSPGCRSSRLPSHFNCTIQSHYPANNPNEFGQKSWGNLG